MPPRVLAIAAHPDDIEYVMAGTLLRLGDLGWETHYCNLASGSGGSLEMDGPTTAKVRLEEAKEAARRLGAVFHPPIGDDMEIIYSLPLLRKVAALVREVNPSIVLTHSPQDYMEDHTETCRLAVTASFCKHVPNFVSDPPLGRAEGDVTVYHAMPHGLCGPLHEKITPDFYVETTAVIERKLESLKAHASQQNWLAASQGMNSYLQAMIDSSQENGRRSGLYQYAEGWRRHLHHGFSLTAVDPLRELLAADQPVS